MKMQTPTTSADAAPDPADIAIAQAEARQRRRHRWLIVAGAVSLLVGYPLSVGPLTVVSDSGFCPPFLHRLLEAYFVPLGWAYMNSEWGEVFYNWYLPFFEVRQ